MGLNIFAFSLFAAFVFVAKSECLVASQIHDARSIPDAALIMELLELTPIPTPMPTMPPTASTTEVLTANPTANPTATPTKKPPTIKPTAKPTITKRHAIGTVNQVSSLLLSDVFMIDFDPFAHLSPPEFQIQLCPSQYDPKELRSTVHSKGCNNGCS